MDVLGAGTDLDAERRLARLLTLQDALAEASRTLGAGAELADALAQVLDRVVDPGRGLRAVVLDELPGAPAVLARYQVGSHATSRETPTPAERELGLEVLGTFSVVHRPAGAAAGIHQLAVRLEIGGIPRGALLFEIDGPQGFGDDDPFVLQGLATVIGAALSSFRRLQEQRELERLRSDFISRVSHELRTPLTIISGFAGTLAAHDETLAPQQRHEMLDRIITATIRLEHLVDDVLAIASVEAGTREPHPVLVPIRDVIDLVVHDLGGNGRVQVLCAPDLRVRTDPSLARQTLAPLVQNALQHGEHVEVEATSGPAGVRIAVSDDGPGIPEELGERVFDRFVRGDDRSPGMGLGLAVARSAGSAIGAELGWEPTSAGARFVLQLPTLDPR